MLKKLLTVFTALLFFYAARADSFIVTSNADAGPGTLREAILLSTANGTTVPDIISFNLPVDLASRTFDVLSQLPLLSSNLIIDATTQPGTALGISDAKIILSYKLPAIPPGETMFNGMNAENARDIEIYGIYFRSYSTINDYSGVAVYCNNSKNIRVGAPGKGNLFTGWLTGIGYPEGFAKPFIGSDSIFIQSNIFSLLEDGNTTTYGIDSYLPYDACCKFAVSFKGSTNIKIGGENSTEGNLINFSVCAISLTGPISIATSNFYIIENNSIGCNLSKTFCTTPANPNYEPIHAEGVTGIQITSNQIMGADRIAGIYLTSCDNFSVKGNSINVDLNGNQCNSNMSEGIIAEYSDKGIIGGNQPFDKNIIAFTNNLAGIYLVYCTRVTISKNSTYCNQYRGSILVNGYQDNPDPSLEPFITVQSATANSISGKALPGSAVELFMDDDCALCEGKLYVTSVIADANGNWTYTGANTDKMVATATDVNGSTSEFSIAKINLAVVPVVKPATCGAKNGAITNIEILSGTAWHWEDEAGNTVGTDTLLHNASPGKYRLVVEVGSLFCSYKTNFIEIPEVLLPASLSPAITPASCGINNGTISINYNTTDQTAVWLNASMDSVGEGTLLKNILPGIYYLKLSLAVDATCNQVYGPFEIINQNGPSLNINTIQITPSACSKNNGSITGITANDVTGTPFIQWVDSLNKPVANGYDLLNALPGRYKMKFKDAGGCDTIVTSFYTITDNGTIKIDSANKTITASNCLGASGSIQQINVTGAETYQWTNTGSNAVAGSALDLLNVAAGSYQLQVSNHYGCSITSAAMVVPQAGFSTIGVSGVTSSDGLCAMPNGFVKINSFTKDPASYTFSWTDSATLQAIGTGTALYNLNAGTYQLYAKDNNGCEQMIFFARIKSVPVPVFDYSGVIQKNDNCNLNEASITAIKINGLVGPTTYTWHNQANDDAGNTITLQNAAEGTYILEVNDASVCKIQSAPFTITNTNNPLPTPVYDNLIIPRYSDAAIKIKNTAAGVYSLLQNTSGTPVLQQNNNGNFVIPKVAADTSLYVRRDAGNCSSPVVKVNIKVVDKSFFAVPTAFTPNGDRNNDRLSVKIIGYIELDYFRIFNRFGTMVFETRTINNGWDGLLKGVLQNPGGYVWIAKGKDINGNPVSDKGSFILVR